MQRTQRASGSAIMADVTIALDDLLRPRPPPQPSRRARRDLSITHLASNRIRAAPVDKFLVVRDDFPRCECFAFRMIPRHRTSRVGPVDQAGLAIYQRILSHSAFASQ